MRKLSACRRKLCFYNLTAAQAGSTDADALSLSTNFGVYRTQVDVPAPLGDIVGVADAVAELRTAATNFANFRHKQNSPYV